MKLSCLNSLRLFDFHDAMTTYPRGQPTVPEGHVIHRLANAIDLAFAGSRVEVTSPQGRFAESAAMLDGTVPVSYTHLTLPTNREV